MGLPSQHAAAAGLTLLLLRAPDPSPSLLYFLPGVCVAVPVPSLGKMGDTPWKWERPRAWAGATPGEAPTGSTAARSTHAEGVAHFPAYLPYKHVPAAATSTRHGPGALLQAPVSWRSDRQLSSPSRTSEDERDAFHLATPQAQTRVCHTTSAAEDELAGYVYSPTVAHLVDEARPTGGCRRAFPSDAGDRRGLRRLAEPIQSPSRLLFRSPAPPVSELAYAAPPALAQSTVEDELPSLADMASRSAARLALESADRRGAALAAHQSRLARLAADHAAAEAAAREAEEAARRRAIEEEEAREARRSAVGVAVVELRDGVVGAARAARAAAARTASEAGRAAAAAEATRRIERTRAQFWLEEEALLAPYDRKLGPGHSRAAHERDRRWLEREVDAGWRRCEACERGEPHGANDCVMTMGLLRGGTGEREEVVSSEAGSIGGGDAKRVAAAVTAVVNQMGNMALFDEGLWDEANRQLAERDRREEDGARARKAVAAWAAKVDESLGGEAMDGHPRQSQPRQSRSQPRLGRMSIASKLASARGSKGVADIWERADQDLSDGARGELESLRLDRKDLTEMPALGCLPHLHLLTLSRNRLTHLPEELDEYAPRLARLRADHNLLEGRLAASVARLFRLQVLVLDDNKLSFLPEGLGALPVLRELSAARNLLEELPGSIGECRALEVITVSGNLITHIPETLFRKCKSLEEVYVRNNRLETLPSTLGRARKLKKLDVGGNCISSLPEVSGLKSLEGLWCFGNQLTDLPPGLPGCTSLRILNLDGNRLSALGTAEDGISHLLSLQTLSAADNVIHTIGRELGRSKTLVTTLRELDIRGNRLERVPAALGRLRSLFVLRVLDGNESLTEGMRKIFSGEMSCGEMAHSWGSNASVTSKDVAKATKALSDALDYLETVDAELGECLDWSPGTRRGCAGQNPKSRPQPQLETELEPESGRRKTVGPPKINAAGTLKRRHSVWGLWRGTASRGGIHSSLDGGPGLRGLGREAAGQSADAFLGYHGWDAELGTWPYHRESWSASRGLSSVNRRQKTKRREGNAPRLTMNFTHLGSTAGGIATDTVLVHGGKAVDDGSGTKGVVRNARGSLRVGPRGSVMIGPRGSVYSVGASSARNSASSSVVARTSAVDMTNYFRQPRISATLGKDPEAAAAAAAAFDDASTKSGEGDGDGPTNQGEGSFAAAAAVSRLARRHSLEIMENVDAMRGAEARRAFIWGYRLDALRFLKPADIADVLENGARRKKYEPGEVIATAGEAAESMIVVLEGTVQSKPIGNVGGGADIVWPGQVIGEMSLMTGAPRDATITAGSGGCFVGEISTPGLSHLIRVKPEMLRTFAVNRSHARLQREWGAALRALPAVEKRLATVGATRRLEYAMQEHTRLSRTETAAAEAADRAGRSSWGGARGDSRATDKKKPRMSEPLRVRLRRNRPTDWDTWPRSRRVAAETVYPAVRHLFPFYLLTEVELLEVLGSSPEVFAPGPRVVPIGQDVVTRGQEPRAMTVILAGVVGVYLPHGDSTGIVVEGIGDVPLACVGELGVDDCICEMSLLTGAPASATVRALRGDVHVLEVRKASLARVMSRRPTLADDMARVLARRRAALEAASDTRGANAADAMVAAGEDDPDDRHPDVVAARERHRAGLVAKCQYALRVADAIDISFGAGAEDSGELVMANAKHGDATGHGWRGRAKGGSAMTAARELLHGGHEDGGRDAASAACDAPAAHLEVVLRRVKIFAGLTAAEIHCVVHGGELSVGLFTNGEIIARQRVTSNDRGGDGGAEAKGGEGSPEMRAASTPRVAADLTAATRDPFRGGGPGRLPRFSSLSSATGDSWVDDDCMIVVLSGTASAVATSPLDLADSGPDARRHTTMTATTLREMQAGDWFGELAALTGTPRQATAVARSPGVAVAIIPRTALRRIVARRPTVADAIAAAVIRGQEEILTRGLAGMGAPMGGGEGMAVGLQRMDLAAKIYSHVARNPDDELEEDWRDGGGGVSGWNANAGIRRLMSVIRGRPSTNRVSSSSSHAQRESVAGFTRTSRTSRVSVTETARDDDDDSGAKAMAVVAVSRMSTASRASPMRSERKRDGSDHVTQQLRRGLELSKLIDNKLGYAPVLSTLTGTALNQLFSAGFTLHVFAPGASVIAQCAEEQHMYVIVKGSMEVVRRRENASLTDGANLSGAFARRDIDGMGGEGTSGADGVQPSGPLANRVAKAGRSVFFGATAATAVSAADSVNEDKTVVATLDEGDIVGEMSLLTGAPRSAEVRAGIGGAEAVEITKQGLEHVLTNNPKMQAAVGYIVAIRQLCASGRLNPFTFPSKRFKCDSHDAEEAEQAVVALIGEPALQAIADRLALSIDMYYEQPAATVAATRAALAGGGMLSQKAIAMTAAKRAALAINNKRSTPAFVKPSPWSRVRSIVAKLRTTSAIASLTGNLSGGASSGSRPSASGPKGGRTPRMSLMEAAKVIEDEAELKVFVQRWAKIIHPLDIFRSFTRDELTLLLRQEAHEEELVMGHKMFVEGDGANGENLHMIVVLHGSLSVYMNTGSGGITGDEGDDEDDEIGHGDRKPHRQVRTSMMRDPEPQQKTIMHLPFQPRPSHLPPRQSRVSFAPALQFSDQDGSTRPPRQSRVSFAPALQILDKDGGEWARDGQDHPERRPSVSRGGISLGRPPRQSRMSISSQDGVMLRAARLSYTGGRLSFGSRSKAPLAIAPREAAMIKVGEVPTLGTFGEMSALVGEPRGSTVVCAESGTRVLLIPAAAFRPVVRRRPALVEEMAQLLAWRRAVAVATAEAAEATMTATGVGATGEAVADAAAVKPIPPSAAEVVALAATIATFVGI